MLSVWLICALGPALVATLASVVLVAEPAGAHPGSTAPSIAVGVVTPIGVLVPADYGQPIVEVDIAAAPGFSLVGGEAPSGWTATRTGSAVVFTGGTIPADNPGLVFTVKGSAPTAGRLVLPVTTHSPSGTVMHYTGGIGSRDAGAVVDAGSAGATRSSGSFPWKGLAGGAVVGVGVVGTAVAMRRRRVSA